MKQHCDTCLHDNRIPPTRLNLFLLGLLPVRCNLCKNLLEPYIHVISETEKPVKKMPFKSDNYPIIGIDFGIDNRIIFTPPLHPPKYFL